MQDFWFSSEKKKNQNFTAQHPNFMKGLTEFVFCQTSVISNGMKAYYTFCSPLRQVKFNNVTPKLREGNEIT